MSELVDKRKKKLGDKTIQEPLWRPETKLLARHCERPGCLAKGRKGQSCRQQEVLLVHWNKERIDFF